MSYIEMPVAEYRRRLAALPVVPSAGAARAATARPVPTVTAEDVDVARVRYPEAFAALDAEAGTSAEETAERERLIVAAIRAVHGFPA